MFVSNDGHIRISDFGGSQFLHTGQRLSRHQREQDLIADIAYCAPEMFMYDAHGVAYYDESTYFLSTVLPFFYRFCTGVDWYSLGATMFFLSTGQVFQLPGSDSCLLNFVDQPLMPPTPDRTKAVQMIRRGPVHAWQLLNGPTEFRNFVTEVRSRTTTNRKLLKHVTTAALNKSQ